MPLQHIRGTVAASPRPPRPAHPTWSGSPSDRANPSLRPTRIRQVRGRFLDKGASNANSLPLCLSVLLARTRASGSATRPHFVSALDHAARFRDTIALSFNGPLHQPADGIPADTASSVHNEQLLDTSQRFVAHITLKVILPSWSFVLRQLEESLLRRTVPRPRSSGPQLLHDQSGLRQRKPARFHCRGIRQRRVPR